MEPLNPIQLAESRLRDLRDPSVRPGEDVLRTWYRHDIANLLSELKICKRKLARKHRKGVLRHAAD